MRTIEWRGDHAVLIDQTQLPHEIVWLDVRDVDTMIDAIRRLAIRGAPAIGVAGGFAVALAAQQAEREGRDAAFVRGEADRIAAARPTAVNLSWAVRRVLGRLDEGVDAVVAEAVELCEEDVRTNQALAAAAQRCSRSCADSRCVCTHIATPAGWRPSSGGPLSASCAPCTSVGT